MSSAFHIHIGGAGVMIGDMLWKLYEKEYNEATQNNYIYEEVDGNHYPLALFVDTDDRMIHEVQRNKSVKFKKQSFYMEKRRQQLMLEVFILLEEKLRMMHQIVFENKQKR